MIERYEHYAASSIFDPDGTIHDWAWVEVSWLKARNATDDPCVPDSVIQWLEDEYDGAAAPPTAKEVANHEKHVTGHDVVAFLDLWTKKMPPEVASQVHFGLTSSDVVDTVHFRHLSDAHAVAIALATELQAALTRKDNGKMPRLGRTHGQFAEPTTMEHRIQVWQHSIESWKNRAALMHGDLHILKTPGATGCGWHFSAETIAHAGLTMRAHSVTFSTQVIPRHRQFAWAALMIEIATIVEDIAMEFRLAARAEVAEIQEQASAYGSSAMPGKRNPIKAENLCGLARLARGYLQPLAETVALHNDRDISNSSVERVACQDLCHVVFTMLERARIMVDGATFDAARMEDNLRAVPHQALASTYQALLQRHFCLRSVDASDRVKQWMQQGCSEGVTGLLGKLAQHENVHAFTGDLMLAEAELGL